jgi:hypothetical protein
MKYLAILILIMTCSSFPIVLKGTAVDSLNQRPLRYIPTEILETGITDTTDSAGNFMFKDPPDDTLHFFFKVGGKKWISVTRKITWSDSGDTVIQIFQLVLDSTFYVPVDDTAKDSLKQEADTGEVISIDKDEEEFWLPTMVVRGRKLKKSALGKQTIDRKAIKKLPGLAEPDVMRTVQMLPGVVASSDFSNKLYVRGGSSDQNLILLDMATVYCPSHFGGFFSTFNVDAIHDMEFYKGGFPARFGNRLSSVLDISQRKGKDGYFHGGLGLSLLSGKAYYEGGIPGKAHWIWTYRRTWIGKALEAMEKLGIMDFELPYFFYDSQGKIVLDLTPRDTLTFSGYFGDDVLDFSDLFGVRWGNEMGGINYSRGMKNKRALRIHGSVSSFSQTVALLDSAIIMDNKIRDLNFKLEMEFFKNEDFRFLLGTESNFFNVIFEQDIDIFAMDTTFSDNTVSFLHSLFGDLHIKLHPDVILKPGLRSYFYAGADVVTTHDHLFMRDKGYYVDFNFYVFDYKTDLGQYHLIGPVKKVAFDPRLGLEISLTPRADLLGHVGRYTQFLTSIAFGDMEMPTEYWYAIQDDMKAATVDLFSLGLKYKVDKVSDFSLEGYYKLFKHLPLFSTEPDPDMNMENSMDLRFSDFFEETEGYSFGFETMIDKRAGLFNGYLSYALGYSIIKEKDTLVYFSRWDKRHSLNLVGNFDWYGSGLPYTRVLGVKHNRANRQDEYIQISGDKFGERYPVYSRVDLTLIRGTRKYRLFDITWYYQIINLFDHENVFYYQFDYHEEENGRIPAERETFYQLPRIPIFIGFEIEF